MMSGMEDQQDGMNTNVEHDLINAVKNNNESEVIRLINAGAGVNQTERESGKTALFYAIQQSNNECVARALIDAGADVKRTDNEGKTALFYANKIHNVAMACELIDAGSTDFSISEIDAKGVLLNAVRNGKTEVVRKLIRARVAVDEVVCEGKNALFEAVCCSNETIVRLLVEEGKAFVNARDLNGRTPLFYAITKSTKISKYLIEKGADVKVKDFRNRSVLSFFIEYCMMNKENVPLSSLMSDKSEEFNMLKEPNKQFKHYIKTMLGIVLCKLPLMCALEENPLLPSCIKKIWNNFSPALTVARIYFKEQRNTKKMNSIDSILKMFEDKEAFSRNCSELIQLLVDLGANSNFADADGNTALHYVTHLPFLGVSNEVTMSVLTQLARHGLSLNAKNNQNQTPLLFCLTGSLEKLEEKDKIPAMKTLVQVCTFLVNNGSNIEETTKSGESVFHLIIKLFQKGLQIRDETARKNVIDEALKIWELFLSDRMIKGNTVNKRDFHLNSPLHYWASLAPSPNYSSSESFRLFSDTLEKILQHLLNLGTILNARNKYEETPLHLCKTRTAVKLLLNVGANPNDVDSSGSQPLLVAALYLDVSEDAKEFQESAIKKGAVQQSNNESVFSALIDAGADVNRTDNEGKTPVFNSNKNQSMDLPTYKLFLGDVEVHYNEAEAKAALFDAAKNDTPGIIEHLHDAGLDLDITDDDGKTALFYANESNRMDALCVLIDLDVEFELDKIDGKAVLFHAAKNKDFFPFLVERLLRRGIFKSMTGDDVIEFLGSGFEDDYMEDGVVYESIVECDLHRRTVLFWAAKNDFDEVVWRLHDAGLDLNITDDDGKTAVFYANENKSMDALSKLIDLGAEFKLDEIDGKAVLFHAAKHYQLAIDLVSKLYHAGLDVNVTDDEGKTALFYANSQYSNYVLCELIECGADFNLEEIDGKAALFHAVTYGMNVTLSKLLSARLDVNITDNYGKTALFYAVQQSNSDSVVRVLIDAGADVNRTDNEGKTALFYAVDRDAVDALIEKGKVLLNARDQYGRTALFYALERCSMTTARYLIEKGENLYLKDKCGVSIFAFFIEKFRWGTLTSYVSELFQEQRQLNSLADAVLDVIFCQAPLLSKSKTYAYLGREYIILELYVLEALTFARNQRFSQDDDKRKAIDEILSMISEDEVDVPSILALLNTLDVNPDAADSDGNTALHYAALLPHYGASQETAIEICKKLKNLGAMFNVKNQQQQSPLLLCLSSLNWDFVATEWPWDKEKASVRVCRFLLNSGSSVNETSQSGESAFHLLMKFVRRLFNRQEFDSSRPDVLQELIDLLELVSSQTLERGKQKIANKTDDQLNSPLHLWASLTLPLSIDYSSCLTEDRTFENILQLIFEILLKCGAKLNPRNENEDTPLHLCKTWTAVKLLINAGANTNDLNSSKRSPLIVAAKNKSFITIPNCVYPDVSQEKKSFWKEALAMGLDPWTVDKHDESVLSILVESEAFELAKSLVDVACEDNYTKSESITISLLNALCKDKSIRTNWKANLVQDILKSRKCGSTLLSIPLRYCCENVIETGLGDVKQEDKTDSAVAESLAEGDDVDAPPPKRRRTDERRRTDKSEAQVDLYQGPVTVHCEIIKLLRWYGAGVEACEEIAKEYSQLSDLLLKPLTDDQIKEFIPWTSVSKKYEDKLAKVARRQEYAVIDHSSIWYHRDLIGSGSFGHIFAGINEKDGREVAIKRIERLRLQRPQDKREIQNLTALADCQQVVRYVSFFEDQDFCYVVLELMEGNLEEYLNESTIDASEATRLCKDVVMGLKFLHEQNILHRDLKPQNILYKKHPKLCLKIADFGLSRRIDTSSSTSVYGTIVGTRCWISPEILNSPPKDHSKSSDIFSCGLLLHYILSRRKHPFSPVDFATDEMKLRVVHETEVNLMEGKMREGWDNSLSPEASHLVGKMIQSTVENRPSAKEAIDHPLFWTKEKKIDFLIAVGNQKEFECPRAKRGSMGPLTGVETDLENSFGIIVKYRSWRDLKYLHVSRVYLEMTRRDYNTSSAVELVRFIRNAYAHVSELKMRAKMLEDFVFLEYFPALVMEVYKAVTTHGWDQTRDEIKFAMNK